MYSSDRTSCLGTVKRIIFYNYLRRNDILLIFFRQIVFPANNQPLLDHFWDISRAWERLQRTTTQLCMGDWVVLSWSLRKVTLIPSSMSMIALLTVYFVHIYQIVHCNSLDTVTFHCGNVEIPVQTLDTRHFVLGFKWAGCHHKIIKRFFKTARTIE